MAAEVSSGNGPLAAGLATTSVENLYLCPLVSPEMNS